MGSHRAPAVHCIGEPLPELPELPEFSSVGRDFDYREGDHTVVMPSVHRLMSKFRLLLFQLHGRHWFKSFIVVFSQSFSLLESIFIISKLFIAIHRS